MLAGGIEFLAYPEELVPLRAVEACGVSSVAVQFDDVFGGDAGLLMQVGDVLCHQAGHLTGSIERCQRAMAAAGLGTPKTVLHGQAPPPGFVTHLAARQKILELDRLGFGPYTPRGAEKPG